MLEHGGNLQEAARRFDRPVSEWLDLSTGINPRFYPVPALSNNAWHRLPEKMAALTDAAQAFYGAPAMLAVAGTQAAIQALPRLRLQNTGVAQVVVAAPSYAEHAYQWRQHGHQVQECTYDALESMVPTAEVLVVCNPNNPTGECVAAKTLLRWSAQMAERGAWLIVDEAFADTTDRQSVAQASAQPGLIVLRSVGKFFGLAGLRLGFVAAHTNLLSQLENMLGPWSISGPAQEIACAALQDAAWQTETRQYLQDEGKRLQSLLSEHGIASTGTALFQWCSDAALQGQTEQLWRHLAGQGIWVRLFREAACGLRFGLPPDEAGWKKLTIALDSWR
ncbi:MAG: threonine-phosphate decarboxylase CobD [Pseudomonadota bacterium]